MYLLLDIGFINKIDWYALFATMLLYYLQNPSAL